MGCLFFAEVDKKVDIDPTLPKDESATGKEGSASPFEASSKSPAYSMGSYVDEGGFQLLDLIIMELKSHMTCSKFKVFHWWKLYLSKKYFIRFALQSEC